MFGAVLVRQVVAAYLIAISFCFLRGLVVAKLRESVKSEQASTLDLFYARGNRSLERTVHAGFCNKVSNRNRPMDDAIFRLRYSTAASKHFFFKKKVSNGDSAYHTSIQVRDFPTRMTCAECKRTHCDYCRQWFPRAMNMLEFSALALVATHRLTNCCFF